MFQPQKYKIILRVDQTADIYEGVTKVLIKGTGFANLRPIWYDIPEAIHL